MSSSPFLLNATLQHHFNQHAASHPELVERLNKSIYVDDIISGAPDDQPAYQMYFDSKEILKKGRLNLRKFVTNSSDLQQKINEMEGELGTSFPLSISEETLGAAQVVQSGEHKVLGVQ